jgi:ABC-type uncharacterized transport system substrate-binding protein
MRSTLDIDPHLYCAHWASGRNWQPQAISSWPARLEGQDIFIDFRWAEGNYARLAEFAAELIRLRVDVLVTYGTPGTLAAKQATAILPIIMLVSGDAVATGIVASLARPGSPRPL